MLLYFSRFNKIPLKYNEVCENLLLVMNTFCKMPLSEQHCGAQGFFSDFNIVCSSIKKYGLMMKTSEIKLK